MKRILAIIPLAWALSAAGTTFTEFYCLGGANGTNVNAGSTTSATASYCCSNANWDGTSVFTLNDGANPASVCTTGAWVSISLDAATSAGVIGLVTGIVAGVNGTISVNTLTTNGSPVSSSSTGRSLRVGGAWAGPHYTTGFPFTLLNGRATNGPQNIPCCNISSVGGITAGIVSAMNGPVQYEGMTSTPHDGGRATIDGGGANINLCALSGSDVALVNLTFSNVGTSAGSADGLTVSGSRPTLIRVVAHDIREHGIVASGIGAILDECETYSCGLNASASSFPIRITGGASAILNSISHNNIAGVTVGFQISYGSFLMNDIADSNGGDGFAVQCNGGNQTTVMLGCDAFNNQGNGINLTLTGLGNFLIQNCNCVSNALFGITSSGSSARTGAIVNCGFGSGTYANVSGALAANLGGLYTVGTVTYTANTTPYNAPSTGDFRITSTQAKAAGRSVFTQVKGSYTGTVGYPDIGAAQAADTNAAAAAVTTARAFMQ